MTEAEQRNNSHGLADLSHSFSMKILLYTNPTKLSDDKSKHIKSLLKCNGVDIRYLETKEERRLRISLRGTKLFLSMSNEQGMQVCEGILYEAKNDDSLLLTYFRERVKKDFERAKKVKLDTHDRIVNADNWEERLRTWLKSDRGINVISLWIGIVGVVLTVFATATGVLGCSH